MNEWMDGCMDECTNECMNGALSVEHYNMRGVTRGLFSLTSAGKKVLNSSSTVIWDYLTINGHLTEWPNYRKDLC